MNKSMDGLVCAHKTKCIHRQLCSYIYTFHTSEKKSDCDILCHHNCSIVAYIFLANPQNVSRL